MTDKPRPPAGRISGVQSVEVALRLLKALARAPGPASLTVLAAETGMAPAKAHRYLTSLIAAGMVRHRQSGSYDLGPGAAEIGIAAIARHDPVNAAADALPGLVDRTGLTGLLAVWGNRGPTVVRWEKAATPLVTTLGLGSVLPVTSSATGLAFLAHLPDRLTAPAIAAEIPGKGPGDFADAAAEVRRDGLAIARQDFIPGLYAMACPVLDLQDRAAAVVTLITTDPKAIAPGSAGRRALAEFTPASA
ncbi:IclR family transcriptional regulator [Maritimibacter sp. 55A14]|uniref:IclR family transcriptional regulator n=1 Tax=Maritimibacter sp. 55A14 TaxID=2174844 RepID=UPI001304EB1D|nr:IclR family transcriptional regulator [Maritimibacter sp. 55A14]